jgi:tRNA A-37 threonylcarbamoyl transferase component Bud32
LYDCLILFESKLTITDAAFGQVAQYMQNLLPEEPASAILFDRSSFWLIKSSGSAVVKVEIAKWTDNGSKSLFQNFIEDNVSPWVSQLTIACSCFCVDVMEGDAFLGCGAFGRVFKVIRQDGEVCALKIVPKRFVARLYQEMRALERAQNTGLTATLAGQMIETPECMSLLLSPVGKPLPHPRTCQEVQILFELLWQLHEKGLVHGDPRVPNVIVYEGKLLWIDLVEVIEASPALKEVDAEILTRSIFRISQKFVPDVRLKVLIKKYGENSSKENIDLLADTVCEYLRLSK